MKIKKCLLLFPLLLCTCTSLAACNHQDASTSTSVTTEAPSNIQIKVTSTIKEVSVGNTITIRVLVSGTAKRDVVWSSSDETIATVEGGRVTGISEGKADIKIALAADPSIYTSVEVTVIAANKPTSVKINGEGNGLGWVGEDTTISVTITPENADPRLTYKSSDETVATIDENGKISFLKTGEVEITVTSTSDPTVFDKKTYEVKKGMFFTNKGGYADNMDYSHQADKEAYIQTKNKLIEGDNPAAMAWFNAMPSTKYYAEVTFNILASTTDGWTRVGIGSGSNDNDTRGFYFSPKEGQKTVMMDVPNGWGAITAQSMIWQANGISTMDPSDLKLGILRDGDNYYYLLNNKLYWFEISDKFHDVNTYPTIITKDTQINITNWSVTLDKATIDEKLNTAAFKQVFFNADTSGHVTFVSDSEFSMTGGAVFQNAAVKPLGDKALLKGNFAIEFDLSGVGADANNDNNTRIGVALRQVGIESPYVADTFAMTNNGAQAFDYRIFNWSGGDHTYWQNQDKATRADGVTVEGHYKLVRTLTSETSATLVLYFNDAAVLNITTSYVGNYHPIFGANLASGTFRNVTFYGIE